MSLKANRDRGKVLGIHDVTKRRLREEKVELPLFLKSNFDIFHKCTLDWFDYLACSGRRGSDFLEISPKREKVDHHLQEDWK